MTRPASLTALWADQAAGNRGWTLLPRLAVWLCVPAIVMGVIAGVSLVTKYTRPPADPFYAAWIGVAAGIQVWLALLALPLTPIAAVLVLVISLRRAWRLRVVTLLWLVVLVSAAVVLPALDATFAQFMILRGASQSVP